MPTISNVEQLPFSVVSGTGQPVAGPDDGTEVTLHVSSAATTQYDHLVIYGYNAGVANSSFSLTTSGVVGGRMLVTQGSIAYNEGLDLLVPQFPYRGETMYVTGSGIHFQGYVRRETLE